MAAFVVVLLLSNVIGAGRRGVVGWLKRREGADVYDTVTDFTPSARGSAESPAFDDRQSAIRLVGA